MLSAPLGDGARNEKFFRAANTVVVIADSANPSPSVTTKASVLLDLLAVERGTKPVSALSDEAVDLVGDIACRHKDITPKHEELRLEVDTALHAIRYLNPVVSVPLAQFVNN